MGGRYEKENANVERKGKRERLKSCNNLYFLQNKPKIKYKIIYSKVDTNINKTIKENRNNQSNTLLEF